MLTLSSLPKDLILTIADHLSGPDLKALAAVNSTFRDLLAASVFSTVKVRNNAECAGGLQQIAIKYGRHVRELCFIEHAIMYKEDETLRTPTENGNWTYAMPEPPWDPRNNPVLEPEIECILEGHSFPQAQKVSVQFKYVDWMTAWSCTDGMECVQHDRSAMEFYYDESILSLSGHEAQWRWRAIMVEVWLALAQNQHIRHLRIEPLISKLTTSFFTEEFRSMLSRLESLHIGTQDLSYHAHALMLSRLGEVFLQYTTSLRTLKVEFPYIVHLPSSLYFAKGLRGAYMPRLQHFELRKSFVGKELIQFVKAQASTLWEVKLDACMCSPNDSIGVWPEGNRETMIKWSDIFKSIRETSIALTTLTITPRDGFDHPILEGPQYPCVQSFEDRHGREFRSASRCDQQGFVYEDREREPEEIKPIRQRLRDEPGLWGFEYFELDVDDERPTVPAGHGLGIEMFERGDDQREFDLLQEVLAVRRAARR